MAKRIKPPRMRLPRKAKKDRLLKVKVRFDHPSFTGLGRADETTDPDVNRAIPVSFIRNMLVYYGEDLISRFRMSSAISDDPLITFKIMATKNAPIRVVFVDNLGERWEAKGKVKLRN